MRSPEFGIFDVVLVRAFRGSHFVTQVRLDMRDHAVKILCNCDKPISFCYVASVVIRENIGNVFRKLHLVARFM